MNSPIKLCHGCDQTFPATSEYFYRDRSHSDGLRTLCKACSRESAKRHYERHAETIKQKSNAYYHSNKTRINIQKRQYRERTKEATAERNRAYNQREYVKERKRQRRKDNLELYRARDKVYQQAYRKRHPERRREIGKRWRQNHPDRKRADTLNRIARLKKAEGSYTPDDVARIYEQQKGCCAYCGKPVNDNYHVDHVIPISRGGTNYPENLAIACPFCNDSKGSKLLSEWIPPQEN
jgi:5-methylcytosine-specific restriction endonuclease McrA